MKIQNKTTKSQFLQLPHKRAGFSLIVTVTIMILLSLIAVGLLSLSTTTLRASTATSAQLEARNNARLAVQMAIAQLQGLSGLDTRITASAKLVDDSNIEVAGVWRSWEGTNNDNNGEPIAPDYDSKNRAGDPTQSLDTGSSGRFLGYLTSTSVGENPDAEKVPNSSTTQSEGHVKLVSDGTVDSGDEVFLEPTLISSTTNQIIGGLSWWTTGDNSKALVNLAPDNEPEDTSDWQERLRGNRLPDPEVFGLSELDDMTSDDAIIPSRRSLDFINNDASAEDHFYHRTTYNKGLLTNVATGGWRKDLSLLSEFFNEMPTSGLPLFAHEPGESLEFNREGRRGRPTNALLYHWKDYLGSASSANWQQTPPICSWTALTNYMKDYENLTSSSTGSVSMRARSGKVGSSTDRVAFQEQIRLNPQIARIQWVLSLGASPTYQPAIVLTPIITVWNPYNVKISVSNYELNFDEVFPLRLSFTIDGIPYDNVPLNSIINNKIRARISGTMSLEPGENKVYGIDNSNPVANDGNDLMVLSEGYSPNGGVYFTGLNKGNPIRGIARSRFEIRNVDFAATGLEGVGGGSDGIGIRFQASSSLNNNTNIIVMSYQSEELGGASVINKLYPPITTTKSVNLRDVRGSQNEPFATATLGLRMVSPPPSDTRFSNIRTKGMLQANPLQHYAEVGAGNDGNAITNLALSGAYHPINAPYDFVISEADSWNDSLVTVDFDNQNRGYLLTGTTSADGLNRAILAELPTKPLQSLADLQHFDARNNNQMPPFQFNLIGNSSAHPIFGSDQLSINTRGQFAGLSNDDSYMLNHLFFDDWFVSSIAPEMRDFSSREERSIESVFTDFIEDNEPLPNWFYTPSKLAGDGTPDELADRYLSGSQDSDTNLFGFEAVSSLLEVEGMFNINSISTDAWKAVLRRNRDLEVPFYSSNNSVSTENAGATAFPRTTVAGDVEYTKNSVVTSNAVASLAGGYMTMTDSQIDALAEEIVLQVKERGPFLSLSEFVNRQLSSNTELALAGTIQRALDKLAQSSSSERNPFLNLQEAGHEITRIPPGNADYKFPEAAFGSTNFGVPGWARQADILRPLAPIMSARDDTFTIRAYGDSRDKSGNVLAQAWCEVVVQRQAEYLDPTDAPQLNPHSNEITSEANERFGRRYNLVSFRWLKESEV